MQVVAAAGVRALAAEYEAAFVFEVDEFVGYGRGVGEEAEPAEGVDFFIGFEDVGGYGLARYAVEAVAACDEVAVDAVGLAVLLVGGVGGVAFDVEELDVVGVVDGFAACLGADVHEIACDFGLAVYNDGAADFFLKVDAVAFAVYDEFDAVVDEAFFVQAFGCACAFQALYGCAFEYASSDAAEYVIAVFAFEDDVVDAAFVQQLAKQQSGGAGTDDENLGTHDVAPVWLMVWNVL